MTMVADPAAAVTTSLPRTQSQGGASVPSAAPSTSVPPFNTATATAENAPAPPGDAAAPSLPDREWETSPMYLALSTRLAKTESSLASLSSQVAHLTTLVRSLSAGAPSSAATGSSALQAQGAGPRGANTPVFSPFEGPDPAHLSPFVQVGTTPGPGAPGSAAASASSNSDTNVAALTTQIAALSASVAQLQRLQQNQAQLTRQNSGQSTPGGQNQGPGGGHSHFNRALGVQYDNNGERGFNGNNRPNISRSMSSNVPQGDGEKWGSHQPKFAQSNTRDWSPGPHGQMTPGGGGVSGGAGGAAAPGAGIVVTKWDHLNLKVELLRSISKYGIGPPNKIQARVLPFMLRGSDIIAQAPPTQERIIAYVIPALQLCLTLPPQSGPWRGPSVIIITTTVDQAAQCHKLVRSVGGPLGVRSALAAGAAGSSGLPSEIAAMQRDAIHLLIGTPAKVAEVISTRGGISGSEVRLLILDEVDQLIARNLYENVLNVAKLLPSPRRGGAGNVTGPLTPSGLAPFSPTVNPAITSPFDGAGNNSPFNPASKTPFPAQSTGPSRFGAPGAPPPQTPLGISGGIERQTCIFSNTIPTDVVNFSQQLQVRDPVRVLVRREGGANSQESVSSVTPGINIKHTYVYLTITGSARSDAPGQVDVGPGTIGSGRGNGSIKEEANRAKEYKLDMLVRMLDDYPLWQGIIHVGTYSMLEAVVYKLQSRHWETLYLAPDMPQQQKKAVLQQWRSSAVGHGPRFLVIFDVNVKPPEIPWAPLVINFDLPRSVEGYAHRAAAAVPPGGARGSQVNGVIVSFVQAAGGDVEMLRSTECAYRFKSAEIPSVFHDLFQH